MTQIIWQLFQKLRAYMIKDKFQVIQELDHSLMYIVMFIRRGHLYIRQIFNQTMNRLAKENQILSTAIPLYDYVIVGAGISGIQAAQILTKKPCSIVLIEAQDYEGGRVDSLSIAELQQAQNIEWIQKNKKTFQNVYIEKGATWVEQGHSVMRRICNDYKIKLNEQYSKGTPIYLDERGPHTSKQLMKSQRYGPSIKNFINKIDYLSKLYDQKVLSAKQTTAIYYKMLQEYDSKTVTEFLEENIEEKHVRNFIQNFFEHTQCISCDQNSMHEVLTKNARSNDVAILKQFLGQFGHQPSYLIDGGTFELIDKFRQQIQKQIKAPLDSILKLRHQVITIDNKRKDFSTVVAINHSTNEVVKVRGKLVICAIPIAVSRSISFTNISQAKRYIFDNQLRTTCSKSFIITRKPFWRSFATGDGLFSYEYPINMCHDISPDDETCGILVFFHSGKKYIQWQSAFKQATDQQKAKKSYLIDLMCKMFNVKVQQRDQYFEDAIFYESTFMNNQFIRSGFQSNTRPGTFKRIIRMKQSLDAFYRNENGIIFVGSEYSLRFASYIQGAIRSARQKIYPLVGLTDPYTAQMKM